MSRSISNVFVFHETKDFGELTRDCKYVDRHGEELRRSKDSEYTEQPMESLSSQSDTLLGLFKDKYLGIYER